LDAQDGKGTAILKALKRLEEELINEAPRKKGLKRKGKPQNGEIDAANIISVERTKSIQSGSCRTTTSQSWNLLVYFKSVDELL
jgi:hypothetical protein